MNEIQAYSANEIQMQVNLIQEVMKKVMKDGTHYGRIPGCGDKKVLLKPGAEKLSLTFHLRPVIDNDRDIRVEQILGHEGHVEKTVYCHILNSSGLEIATGIGSCSTMESKYRYRGGEKKPTGELVPKEYWNLRKEGQTTEAQQLLGGPRYGASKIDGVWQICEFGEKMENPDIADTYNTVLKMAKKRAYVDGILSATAASDIFTQDIIDEEDLENVIPSKEHVKQPRRKTAIVDAEAIPPEDSGDPEQKKSESKSPICVICGGLVSEKSAEFCEKKGMAPTCFNCQQAVKNK
jgi:hypothetical protein